MLRHIPFCQGGKAYGADLGPFKTPARENDPRLMPPNFYHDQEDLLRRRQQGKPWHWTAQRPEAIGGYTMAWDRLTPYRQPGDWVFASGSARAGKMRGKQPLWLSSITRYRVQPMVKDLGIHKRVSWHTFRRTYTTLLHANGEDVKVVQELLRHSSSRITLDIYAQAQMPAQRAAQHKVVEMMRPELRPQVVELGA